MYDAQTQRWFPVMLLLSIGSGAAALIYEVVWFQLLELAIGSSAVSLAVLLATFMGGTCLGSLFLPRIIPARLDPMRVYAAIEIGILILGMMVLLVTPLVGSLSGFLFRGLVTGACLLLPTFLMGATLPTLARRVEVSPCGVSWMGVFYTGNIGGAVFGCLLAGFYLLRKYDVATATYIAAAINAAVGALAFFMASRWPAQSVAEVEKPGVIDHPYSVYVAIGLSGLCALAAEAIWTRMLGLLLGASVYTLSIVVAVFLIGLGIGSSIGSLLCRIVLRPRLALAWCQLLAAVAVAWTAYSLAASLPYWPINPSLSSDIWFNFQLDLDRAFWALLPPTLLWGASFPLALAAIASNETIAAKVMSRVYAANTMGGIIGALGSSLLLISWVGSQRTEQLLIALSVLSGLLLLPPRKLRLGLAAVVACGLLIYSVPPISTVLVAHGRFAPTWVGKGNIVYAREGLNSSVAVSNFPNAVRTFHVAGKIQASNVPRDMRLQRMLGHLTSLIPAHPQSVLVIGCGAGVTAGAVSIDPAVERETIVEIEPLVPRTASDYFSKENFNVIGSPKVTVYIDDGRHYLLTTNEKFDAITADPLDPWVKGAANLYTREFLEVMKRHLAPGGVVTLYVQLFETNLDAVKSTVATFFEVFPNGTVWGNTYEGKGHDMVLLGQAEPLHVDLDQIDHRLHRSDYARVVQSLAEVGMGAAVDLFATYAGRGSDLKQWLKDAQINRDRNLRMQYLAGAGLNLDDSAAIYADMVQYRRFPADIFTSTEGRLESLREAIQ